MKYLRIILPALALFIIISCSTGTEPDDNNSFLITVNKDTLDVTDILKVIIHSSVKTLSDGTIDFGDSSNTTFAKTNPVHDTIITHSYSKFGTYYVTLKYKYENVPSEYMFIIHVGHYYSLKFPVGMKWVYKYKEGSSQLLGDSFSKSTSGVHTWEVISYSTEQSEYTLKLTRNDTSNVKTQNYDSTSTSITNQYFTIQANGNSLKYNLPYLSYLQPIPNNVFLNQYPIILMGYGTTIICEDKIGIKSYVNSVNISRYSQSYKYLTLISCSNY